MIYLGIFANHDSAASLVRNVSDFESLEVKWSLENFGTQRITFSEPKFDTYDAYLSYRDDHALRVGIYSDMCPLPVSGIITKTGLVGGNRIQYTAKGPTVRMKDDVVDNAFSTATTISSAITTATQLVDIDDGTTTNIVTNSTALGGWEPNRPEGGYPEDVIKELVAKSDSSFRVYDFWYRDNPIDLINGRLQAFTPFYKYREDDVGPDWVISLDDLTETPNLVREINDFATRVRVWYGIITGTITTQSDEYITDTGKNFRVAGVTSGDSFANITAETRGKILGINATSSLDIDGPVIGRGTATGGSTTTLIDTDADPLFNTYVAVGDYVYNDKDDSRGSVTTVTSGTQLAISGAMSGGKSNDVDERYRIVRPNAVADAYAIRTQAQTKYHEAETSTSPYWDRLKSVFEAGMDQDQALEYAMVLADTEPISSENITIGSQWIKDSEGGEVPLFNMLAEGGGYIQIRDLFPYIGQETISLDRLTTFRITAMSWTYRNGRQVLTCSLDSLDFGLSSRLRRAQIVNSEIVDNQF